jgi:hypothetical protein
MCVWQIFALFVFIRIPGCLPNEYEYSNYSNYSNNGYSNETFGEHSSMWATCRSFSFFFFFLLCLLGLLERLLNRKQHLKGKESTVLYSKGWKLASDWSAHFGK